MNRDKLTKALMGLVNNQKDKKPAKKETSKRESAKLFEEMSKREKANAKELDKLALGEREKAKGGKWIQKAIKHPGALHEELHVAMDKKIPVKKLEKASHSKNPTLKKQANLAMTLRGFHKK